MGGWTPRVGFLFGEETVMLGEYHPLSVLVILKTPGRNNFP